MQAKKLKTLNHRFNHIGKFPISPRFFFYPVKQKPLTSFSQFDLEPQQLHNALCKKQTDHLPSVRAEYFVRNVLCLKSVKSL